MQHPSHPYKPISHPSNLLSLKNHYQTVSTPEPPFKTTKKLLDVHLSLVLVRFSSVSATKRLYLPPNLLHFLKSDNTRSRNHLRKPPYELFLYLRKR
jgi:hypothetical protein